MCAGAIVQARMKSVVVGTMNPKAGCAGSILNLLQMKEFNHQVELITGVLEEECTGVLQAFFKDLRIRNKKEKQEG
jgi:tRNA(adenine34) deaminase